MIEKRIQELGMHPSTANGKLIKDILWSLLEKTNQIFCHQCGKEMKRENFSIEHIIPWRMHENAKELFFNLENISYSHLSCNVSAARKLHKKYDTLDDKNNAKAARARKNWSKLSKEEQQRKRREKYIKYKC